MKHGTFGYLIFVMFLLYGLLTYTVLSELGNVKSNIEKIIYTHPIDIP